MVERDNPLAKPCHARSIINALSFKQNMCILDMGCGTGRVSLPLAQAMQGKGVVVAMDVQQGMLEKVRVKAEALQLENLEYLHSGLEEASIAPNSIDAVLLVTVIGEIPDQEKALDILFQCLKPGGVLSVSETIFDPHFQAYSHICQKAETVGFLVSQKIGKKLAYTAHFKKPMERSKG